MTKHDTNIGPSHDTEMVKVFFDMCGRRQEDKGTLRNALCQKERLKTREWKTWHHTAGVENVGVITCNIVISGRSSYGRSGWPPTLTKT